MSTHLLLEMPDGDFERTMWLERQFVDFRLKQLVDELTVVRQIEEESKGKTPVSFCGGQPLESPLGYQGCHSSLPQEIDWDKVLTKGLRSLSRKQFYGLLRDPQSLFALQEFILINGGSYWQELSETVHRQPAQRTYPMKFSNWVLATISAAAAVLLVGLFMNAPKASIVADVATNSWGPANIVATATLSLSANEYLDFLADLVGQWYDKRPIDREGLILRTEQFVAGCQAVIEQPHPNLTADRSLRLRHHCEQCQRDLRAQIQLLHQRRTSFALALVAIDESIDRLRDTLRT